MQDGMQNKKKLKKNVLNLTILWQKCQEINDPIEAFFLQYKEDKQGI